MLNLAISVASGDHFLTHRTKQGRVLYMALEDNQRRLKSRLETVLRGKQAPDNLHLADQWPKVGQGGIEQLEEFIKNTRTQA